MAEESKPTASGLIPYILVDGARKAIEFYGRAFGAEEMQVMPAEGSDRLMHAAIRINGGMLFLSDFFPDHGYPKVTPEGFNLHLQVEDADRWWKRAVDAGCEITMPLELAFWGDYYGQLRDPYGIVWAIGQTKKA